jgi:excisionase family DNA binding protein
MAGRRRAGFKAGPSVTTIQIYRRFTLTTRVQMYSRYEASAMLGISFVTLDRLVKADKIRPTKIGRRVLFAGSDLLTFIRSQKAAR